MFCVRLECSSDIESNMNDELDRSWRAAWAAFEPVRGAAEHLTGSTYSTSPFFQRSAMQRRGEMVYARIISVFNLLKDHNL